MNEHNQSNRNLQIDYTTTLGSNSEANYTVDKAAAVLRDALTILENCTEESAQNRFFNPASSKGDQDMANHRQRVRIGTKEDGSPVIKWIAGKSTDELNDNIVRAYIDHNLMDGLLSKEERKALAFHLLETVGLTTDEERLNRACNHAKSLESTCAVAIQPQPEPCVLSTNRSHLKKRMNRLQKQPHRR